MKIPYSAPHFRRTPEVGRVVLTSGSPNKYPDAHLKRSSSNESERTYRIRNIGRWSKSKRKKLDQKEKQEGVVALV